MKKERLDVLLVSKGLFESREKAKSSIMAGVVFVNDKKEDKPGVKVDVDSVIKIKENIHPMSAEVD
ncbi:RNA binding methyltransferase FtsJ like [Acetivibrio straminisolvens JCM 21531]|uniref:RNA binding methyltransferase FtsJ like n=1 Tax=Acetivibrio straminisolvens JCM 21531 TaxID=1294263 RepID=W4V4I7_9FIRM|nr:RNA binding methyltransferase FtsJ like [Acetivibrio straminisolvens JCM 21531]